jgi:hypothetical protein
VNYGILGIFLYKKRIPYIFIMLSPTTKPPFSFEDTTTSLSRGPKYTDTLEYDWIYEEEKLRNANELLQKQLLEKVCIRFVFVDSESNVLMDKPYIQSLQLDISNSYSILSKTALLHCIQTAKTDYHTNRKKSESMRVSYDGNPSSVITDSSSTTVSFSIMDVLLWNIDVETDYLQQYAESLPPEWIGREFVKGNINDDIVFLPSLCIFHSIQTVYVFLRVSLRKHIPNVSVNDTAKKYTRRRNRL